jgi:hypothetical protein
MSACFNIFLYFSPQISPLWKIFFYAGVVLTKL